MKKLSISLIALAALALGACTSDDIALNQNDVVGSEGDGYISFAINLPTQNSTRAANDVFDDGIAAEYNVNDATLYLFEGKSEATAVLSQTIDLSGDWKTYDPADDNITVKQQLTEKVNKPSAGNSLYALVVINGAGVTTGTGAVSMTVGTTTLADLQNPTTAVAMDVATIASVSNANFYMTNAPLWHGAKGAYSDPTGTDSHGDASKVITLAEIDATKIYDTAAQAEDNPATEIYVERGVAKVTMSESTSMTTLPEGFTSVTVDGFCLDLTNLTGYPVRNTSTDNAWWDYASGSTSVVGGAYRMVGNTEVGADLYRTYWALDPNYSTNMYTSGESGNRTYPETVNYLGGTIPTSLTTADGETGAYCLENTFSVAHQNQDETTRAIVAVTLGSGDDFFTFEGVKSVLYTETQICNEVLALFAANVDVQAAVKASWQGLESEGNDIYSYYAASIDTDNGGTSHAVVSIAMADGKSFYTGNFKDGIIPDILNPGTDAFNAVVAEINAEHEFSYYAGGVAYYPVLIQHFGDELCPWDQTSVSTGTPAVSGDNGDSYPEGVWSKTSEQNWLGRYGVLRNNWYDITVTGVSEIGSADVPPAYGEPDDPMYHWISVDINILSWAKRTQSVDL